MRVFVLYHSMFPDSMGVAKIMDRFCEGITENFSVIACSANRAYRDPQISFPLREVHGRIRYRRVWRPQLSQASIIGRIINAGFIILGWMYVLLSSRVGPRDIVVIGSEPIMSISIAPVVRYIFRAKVIHWCWDLYPESAIADGLVKEYGLVGTLFRRLARLGYHSCSAIIDIGPKMKSELAKYRISCRCETITPCAIVETPMTPNRSSDLRNILFGGAQLAVMYSGTFGRAHSINLILKLLNELKYVDIAIHFSVSGHCVSDLKIDKLWKQINVTVGSNVPLPDLWQHLAAADIHIVGLKEAWSGFVVPSKFFGALSVRRPVLFEGSYNSDIGIWIRRYGVGWVLNEDNFEEVKLDIMKFINNSEYAESMRLRCQSVYESEFSQHRMIESWNDLLLSVSQC